MVKWDGHTHSKFCYHGHPAEQTLYLDKAVELGFERYTISEHPPLPERWVDDPKLMAELAMPDTRLPDYFAYVQEMKARYADRIEVTIGLEIDYLHGAESFSDRLVDRWGRELEDVVVSVHYLPGVGGMRCIDFTPEDFRDAFLGYYGSMDRIVDEYYNHVEMAIEWAARLPMRKRIGHINLIEKFAKSLPPIDEALMRRRLEGIVPKLKAAGLGLDVNVAGFRVATCGKAYVPPWLIRTCLNEGIELVYGSDAHRPDHVGADWDWFERGIRTADGG
jgi:histidinol-phosphatase (PHP family)